MKKFALFQAPGKNLNKPWKEAAKVGLKKH
jgi:hypothetical protein